MSGEVLRSGPANFPGRREGETNFHLRWKFSSFPPLLPLFSSLIRRKGPCKGPKCVAPATLFRVFRVYRLLPRRRRGAGAAAGGVRGPLFVQKCQKGGPGPRGYSISVDFCGKCRKSPGRGGGSRFRGIPRCLRQFGNATTTPCGFPLIAIGDSLTRNLLNPAAWLLDFFSTCGQGTLHTSVPLRSASPTPPLPGTRSV